MPIFIPTFSWSRFYVLKQWIPLTLCRCTKKVCKKNYILRIILHFYFITRFTTTFMPLSSFSFQVLLLFSVYVSAGTQSSLCLIAIKRQHSRVSSFLSLWSFLVLALCVLQAVLTTRIWLASLSYLSISLLEGWSCRCMPLQPAFGMGPMHATAASLWRGL